MSLAVALLVAWVVWTGSDYYATALAERPHHDDFRAMRPAGRVGHGLGILGSVMLVTLLVYSLRKRLKFMQRWGDLSVWLRYHIFMGVVGPILITLHTSFKVDGLVAVSYWSMVAVAPERPLSHYNLACGLSRSGNLAGAAVALQVESVRAGATHDQPECRNGSVQGGSPVAREVARMGDTHVGLIAGWLKEFAEVSMAPASVVKTPSGSGGY